MIQPQIGQAVRFSFAGKESYFTKKTASLKSISGSTSVGHNFPPCVLSKHRLSFFPQVQQLWDRNVLVSREEKALYQRRTTAPHASPPPIAS